MRKFYVMAVAAMMATTAAWAQSVVEVTTEAELSSAISTYPEGTVVLTADITLSKHVGITEDKNVTLDLNGHTLQRNLSETDELGNVIRVSTGGMLTIKDSSGDNSGKITGGRAINGGGICNHGTLTLEGGTIVSNSASGCGGGVYNAPTTDVGTPAEFFMTGGIILGNWGGDAGGIYNYSVSSVDISGGDISGNTSNAGGGGLVNYGTADISGGTINNNHATTRGGGIWNGGTLTLEGGTIASNYASIEGGGIYNTSSAEVGIIMTDGVILGNWGNDGGGIYNNTGSSIEISGGAISGNTSNAGGGGVVNYGTANITGGTIHNNHATTRGGGIWNDGALIVGTATINGNRADIEGGGIYMNTGGQTTFSGTIIRDNTSADAGGIYVANNATAELTNCHITGNLSAEHGGGGITNFGNLSLHGATITGNQCLTDGGGIWSGGSLNMEGTVLIKDNFRISGLKSNLYLRNSCFVNVIGSLGETDISVSHEGEGGTVTQGLSGNGGIDNFKNDYPEAATLSLADGEVILTKRSDVVYYIERSWNPATQKIEETINTVSVYFCFFLDDTNRVDDYIINTDATYLVVRGTGRKYNDFYINDDTKLILCDGASLNMNHIYVNENDKLEIYSQARDNGQLIGNNISLKGSLLEIHGGKIDVEPKKENEKLCAAIGNYHELDIDMLEDGESAWEKAAYGFTVSIFGGTVTAKGGVGAAGIGSDNGAYTALESVGTRNISIYGGTVTATGGEEAAGIGGGYHGYGVNINIYGGTVRAYGASRTTSSEYNIYGGAGIGGGACGVCGNINIYGGHVEATGGRSDAYPSGAGIGGGGDASGGNITITGGYVIARGGYDAAGIGSGEEKYLTGGGVHGGAITISGGTVFAYGSEDGAGIGAGDDADMGNIIITGGTVYAQGGGGDSWANAIGTDDDNEGVNGLTIGDQMMVSTSEGLVNLKESTSWFDLDPRLTAMTGNLAVTIQPCTHSGATTTIVDADSHKLNGCDYCLLGSSNVSHTFGSYGECAACGLVSLSDNSNNSSSIAHWNGKTKTVALSGRTLFKDGSWNTLCLPFSLPIAGSPLNGDDVVVQTLAGSSFNEGALTLEFTPVSTIEAGKPYLIKWNEEAEDIVNPVFSNVNISNTTSNVTSDYIDFIGTYSPQAIYQDSDEKTNLYLAGSNKLNYPKDPNYTVNAFRAYFTLKGGLTVGNTTSGNTSGNVRSFTLNFGDEETSINAPAFNRTEDGDEAWYSLDGRRLSGKPTAKGIFLYNGRKVVIK